MLQILQSFRSSYYIINWNVQDPLKPHPVWKIKYFGLIYAEKIVKLIILYILPRYLPYFELQKLHNIRWAVQPFFSSSKLDPFVHPNALEMGFWNKIVFFFFFVHFQKFDVSTVATYCLRKIKNLFSYTQNHVRVFLDRQQIITLSATRVLTIHVTWKVWSVILENIQERDHSNVFFVNIVPLKSVL